MTRPGTRYSLATPSGFCGFDPDAQAPCSSSRVRGKTRFRSGSSAHGLSSMTASPFQPADAQQFPHSAAWLLQAVSPRFPEHHVATPFVT